jgi:HK97 family phage major capsid protein
VSFGYYIAEARIAQSLLSEVVALPVLEQEIASTIAEAFVREFDRIIVSGTGTGQPLGIVNDTRIPAGQKISFTSAQIADWKNFRKLLFSKIPVRYRAEGIFVMTAATWESQILTLADDNNNPVYSETYNPTTGEAILRFNGREVVLVEPDIVKDFDTADDGDVWGLYFRPQDYAINSNLQLGFKRWFDDNTNMWINKGLTIVDGKMLDVNSAYILKKTVPAG